MNIDWQAAIGIATMVGTSAACFAIVRTKVNGIGKTIDDIKIEVRRHHEDRAMHVSNADPPVTEKMCKLQHEGIKVILATAASHMVATDETLRRVERNQIKIAAKLGVEIMEGE